MITVKVTHNLFDKKLKTIERRLDEAAEEAVGKIEENIRNLMLTSSPSGRIYRLPGGGTHQASAPGQPPAIMYGDLLGSFFSQKVRPGLYMVGSFDPNAGRLEYGTPLILPRPVVRPAVEMERGGYSELIRMALIRGANE